MHGRGGSGSDQEARPMLQDDGSHLGRFVLSLNIFHISFLLSDYNFGFSLNHDLFTTLDIDAFCRGLTTEFTAIEGVPTIKRFI